jgi:hypothetical protein
MPKIAMRFFQTLAIATGLVCWGVGLTPAYAWDGVGSGKIIRIDSVPDGNNGDLRVMLTGTPALCTSAINPTWAFINISQANFKGTSATLMMAYALNKTVTLYSNISSAPLAGYCQIGYVMVTD